MLQVVIARNERQAAGWQIFNFKTVARAWGFNLAKEKGAGYPLKS